MSIGIIGSGNVGRALGQLFSHVGEQVILSHRHGVASLAPVIAEMRSTVEAYSCRGGQSGYCRFGGTVQCVRRVAGASES